MPKIPEKRRNIIQKKFGIQMRNIYIIFLHHRFIWKYQNSWQLYEFWLELNKYHSFHVCIKRTNLVCKLSGAKVLADIETRQNFRSNPRLRDEESWCVSQHQYFPAIKVSSMICFSFLIIFSYLRHVCDLRGRPVPSIRGEHFAIK